MSRAKIIYAAFDPQGRYLGVGVATDPVDKDYQALRRLQAAHGGLPDLLVLETVPPHEHWKEPRSTWKTLIDQKFTWLADKPDNFNKERFQKHYEELRAEHLFIPAADLIPKPREVFTVLK